ncbi:hypothetical protein HS7_07010 [Sulfolobales archaeon HS-7]|nr:hypothetical protein HS7_07010 [Sulfolobales archaeon HS-7]
MNYSLEQQIKTHHIVINIKASVLAIIILILIRASVFTVSFHVILYGLMFIKERSTAELPMDEIRT